MRHVHGHALARANAVFLRVGMSVHGIDSSPCGREGQEVSLFSQNINTSQSQTSPLGDPFRSDPFRSCQERAVQGQAQAASHLGCSLPQVLQQVLVQPLGEDVRPALAHLVPGRGEVDPLVEHVEREREVLLGGGGL